MTESLIIDTSDKISMAKRNILNKILDDLHKKINRNNNEDFIYDELTGYIKSIKQVQFSSTNEILKNNKCRKETIAQFYKWAYDNGAKFDGIEISEFPEYDLGLKAKKKFKIGEIYIEIPKKMQMSLDYVNNLEEFTEVLNKFHSTYETEEMSTSRLAMFLIVEKLKTNSFWGPYIDILPHTYSTVLYFDEDDFKLLEEFVGHKFEYLSALNCWRDVTLDYITIYRLIHRFETSSESINRLKQYFTYELYCWAISTVMTRQNKIPVKKFSQIKKDSEVEMFLALIPFWDMANHKNGTITTFYDIEKDVIESSTLSDYEIGEQIFIYYGNRSNSDFIIHNGFVPLDNAENAFYMVYNLRSVQKDRLKMIALLDIKDYWGRYPICPSPNFISPKILAVIRIKEMNKNQFKHWMSLGPKDLLKIDCQLDLDLEEKVWQFILNLLSTYIGNRERYDVLIHRLDNHKNEVKILKSTYLMILQHLMIKSEILLGAYNFVYEKLKLLKKKL